jgi:hypothetical protein
MGLEHIRETQAVQGRLLNLLLKKETKEPAVSSLPTDINLPITTSEQAETLEGRIQDSVVLNTLVSNFHGLQ